MGAFDGLLTRVLIPNSRFHVLLALYSENVSHTHPALLRVCVSADDGEFVYLTNDEDYSFTGADRNWKAYSVDLSQFNGSNNIRIGFDGYTSAYDELLMLDNVSLSGMAGVGLMVEGSGGLSVRAVEDMMIISGCSGSYLTVADVSGRVIYGSVCGSDSMSLEVPSGIYIVSASGKNAKILVR